MDLSGIGMGIVACCFMSLVPPIIAGILFIPIFIVQKLVNKTGKLKGYKPIVLFLILYLISFVGSCFYVYFFYLRDMYVM
jgi:hypothetical protein